MSNFKRLIGAIAAFFMFFGATQVSADTIKVKEIILNYFNSFSSKNLKALDKIFSENVSLEDWDISVNGKKEVLAANKKIFDNVETISVNVKELYIYNLVATCIIEVIINGKEKLNVIDIVKINKQGKIIEINAYKQ
tara:strand:- start:1126 stop:1536 length:411 start_codon:yes stop_codon:yes gene_type:complete